VSNVGSSQDKLHEKQGSSTNQAAGEYGDRLMQIAKLADHRPRPSSGSNLAFFSFFHLSFLPSFSRNGVVAGANTTRNELLPTRPARAWPPACVSSVTEGNGFSNSVGAVWTCRWIVRA